MLLGIISKWKLLVCFIMLLGVMSEWKLLVCFIMLFRRIKIFEQSLRVFFYAKCLYKKKNKKKIVPIASFTILLYRCCKFCSRVKNLRYNCKDQKYKSITKQKRKKHDKIELLAKTKLNTIKVVSKA